MNNGELPSHTHMCKDIMVFREGPSPALTVEISKICGDQGGGLLHGGPREGYLASYRSSFREAFKTRTFKVGFYMAMFTGYMVLLLCICFKKVLGFIVFVLLLYFYFL